jgi:D-glycero-D-manno-heptose 1,7-bisphosphate phosphatase
MQLEGGRRPAVFLDRDGVLNEERHYVGRIADFHWLPGAVAALRRLQQHGFALVVVTNQAGIAKGRFTAADYAALTEHIQRELLASGVVLDGIYHCPHHPDSKLPDLAVECRCRKPAPGMLLQAAQDLSLDLQASALVGDKISDTQAGRAAGLALTVLVESGHTLPSDALAHADRRCRDLAEAAELLCQLLPVRSSNPHFT